MKYKEVLNCNNCLYANNSEDGSILCDKKVLMTEKLFYVPSEKIDLSCPAHSGSFIENWRYVESHKKGLKDCDDACKVCGRLVRLSDTTQYSFILIQDESGKVIGEKMQCKICRHKGRR